MGIHVDLAGMVKETITLPADGKVTGEIDVTWNSRGRATVNSDKVRYRDREFTVSAARFIQDGDEWKYLPENLHSPVRKPTSGMFSSPAALSFAGQVLAAVAEALKGAWSVDTARTVGRETVGREIREAEMEETELAGKLADVRDRLVALRKQYARYSED